MTVSGIPVYSGLTPAQYDSLFTSSDHSCIAGIQLFFRRLVHLLTNCEWITDAKLIDRLYTYVKVATNPIDAEIKKIFSMVYQRSHHLTSQPEIQCKLQDMQKRVDPTRVDPTIDTPYFIDLKILKSPFPLTLWGLNAEPALHNNSKEIIDLEIVFDSENIKKEDYSLLKKRFETISQELENLFQKSLDSLKQHPCFKQEYIDQLKPCFKAYQDFYTEQMNSVDLMSRASNASNEQLSAFEQFIKVKPEKEKDFLWNTLVAIEADMGIKDIFQKHVHHIIDSMLCEDPNWQQLKPSVKNMKATSHSLAMDVRICRQYMIERGIYYKVSFGESESGHFDSVVDYLKIFLNPKQELELLGCGSHSTIDNGCLINECVDQHQNKWRYWIQVFFERSGNHIFSHVYTFADGNPHFVVLDNLSMSKRKNSLEDIKKIKDPKYYDVNCKVLQITIPDDNNYKPTLSPMPEKWILPEWERNNCFFATALVALAVWQFYYTQEKNL